MLNLPGARARDEPTPYRSSRGHEWETNSCPSEPARLSLHCSSEITRPLSHGGRLTPIDIQVDGNTEESVESFTYLGSLQFSDGSSGTRPEQPYEPRLLHNDNQCLYSARSIYTVHFRRRRCSLAMSSHACRYVHGSRQLSFRGRRQTVTFLSPS